MITDIIRGDIFTSDHNHIVFGINAEGYNDAGFAGAVAARGWKELENCGPHPLGTVLERTINGKMFHAVVCHRLERDGWRETPTILENTLNAMISASVKDTVGMVLVGGGPVGRFAGSDVMANLGAIARSSRPVAVYYL
jgi:hypothetical protein